MDKGKVVQAFVKSLEGRLELMTASLESTRERARDSPGSNVSHSDTSKFQLSNVALQLDEKAGEVREAITHFRNLPISGTKNTVALGAVIQLRGDGGDRYYLLVLRGGGEEVKVDDLSISSLTVGAPLGKACIRKEVGDEVECNGKRYELIGIW